MTEEQREARRIAREKRRKKVLFLRRLIKISIYALAAIAVFCIIWFGIRPLAAKLFHKNAVEEAVEETPTVSTDTAVKKALVDDSVGNTGWNCDANGWWYKNSDGTQYVTGWATIEGQRFYFLENGYMATGWQSIDGKDIYFNESGIEDDSAQMKLVALTFDDGPSNNTDAILDVLEQYNAKATFFVVGTQIKDFSEVLVREHDMGMEIGNHTYDHTILNSADSDTIIDVLDKNDDFIESFIGERTTLMRPTGGGINKNVALTVDKPMILWDVDTLDWETLDAETTYKNTIEGVQSGSIILMHDLYAATAEAVKKIVPALQERGYKLVTVSELAEYYGYDLEAHNAYYDLYPDGNAFIQTQDYFENLEE
ncbi:MAG: polysaccharide deacetylase family protein [Lachnospiraceae bacterium]|jgi:peptidoglycan/xylan/chitin deacetylase (PgdA/CDA1 family)